MTDNDTWATLELTEADRDALRDGEPIERLIRKQDDGTMDVLEVRWRTRSPAIYPNASHEDWADELSWPALKAEASGD